MQPRVLKILSNGYRVGQRTQWRWCLAILMILCAQRSMLAGETNRIGHSPGELGPEDLKEKSLKELMEVMVTSVSKKSEKLSEAASAITVITQEDIRRSGATVWGANAVNGVINILTKSARDTQGFLFYGGGGTEQRAFGGVRYGGQLATNAYYRIYAKYFNRDETPFPGGADGRDDWQMGQ